MRLQVCTGILLGLLASAPAFPRDIVPLSKGWHFRFGPIEGDAANKAGFDDSGWQTVSLPHTWNHIGAYALSRSTESDNRQGIGWYRLNYQAPSATPGAHVWLDFAAVGSIAEVWVNGAYVCGHKGAFGRFRCDVTAQWNGGQSNLIAVRADNSKPKLGASTQDVIPLGGDFFIHGGLYRGVNLVTVPNVHIDLADHGGPGVYGTTKALTNDRADIVVRTRIANDGGRAGAVNASVYLLDAKGVVVAQRTMRVPVSGNTVIESEASLSIPNPHRWNGRADPYLYTIRVKLNSGKHVLDQVSQPLGLRDIRFDANQGFFLNGQHLALHGVARHQDRLGKGWALSDADHDEDMALIAEMGANTVRMAHYQHADRWLELADKYGMIAWAEIPFVNAASFGDDEGTPALHENARTQLTELITQAYNHPSVALWSVGNEVDIGAMFNRGKPPRSRALLAELNALAHKLDPSRSTTFADCCEEDNPIGGGAKTEMLAGTTDVMGYNRYYGWYYGTPDQNGPRMDHFHALHPQLPMSVSEYGAGGALSQHSDNPEGGPVNPFGRPHPEEYQSWYHEQAWKQLGARPYIFADWVWNMFDFASDLREEGDSVDINDKGMVSYDRKEKKDSFWFYKAQWSDQPVLHLTSKHYVDRAYPVMDVRAYSNAANAHLMLNGKDIGDANCPDRVCVWHNIALAPGANHVVVSASANGKTLSDSADWTAPDIRAGLRIDSGALSGHTDAAGIRYGSDNFFTGGKAKLLNIAPFRPQGVARSKPRMVDGATDPALFETWREGDFAYDLPLPAGQWQVKIYSFEPDSGRTKPRQFDATANDSKVIAGYSPATVAGGPLKAASISFPVTVTTTGLHLKFANEAVVAAIEISPIEHK